MPIQFTSEGFDKCNEALADGNTRNLVECRHQVDAVLQIRHVKLLRDRKLDAYGVLRYGEGAPR